MAREIQTREKPFPEDLEGRLNSILNVVNTELKTATILHLDDVPAEGKKIRRRLKQNIGRNYLPQGRTFNNYCHATLLPIGMIAEEVTIQEDAENVVVGYRLTEAGKKYGLPIAAFTLDWVYMHDQSLFEILGPTGSKGKSRSPENRIKILEELGKGNALREADLVRIIWNSKKGSLTSHLNQLKKTGLIQFDSCGEMNKPIIVYRHMRDLEDSERICGAKTFPRRIVKLLKEKGNLTTPEVTKILNVPERYVTTTLSRLATKRVIGRGKWKGRVIQSRVNLTSKGKRFLEEYIDPIKDALDDGPWLNQMNETLGVLRQDNKIFGEYLRTAINLYRPLSPNLNKKSKEETDRKILDYITKHPEGTRPSELSKVFSLSFPATLWHLRHFMEERILRKERDGLAVRYFLAEQGEQQWTTKINSQIAEKQNNEHHNNQTTKANKRKTWQT